MHNEVWGCAEILPLGKRSQIFRRVLDAEMKDGTRASVRSPACANEQCQILSSGMFFDCNVNVTINKKE